MYLNEGVRRYFVEAVQHMEGAFVTTTTLECTAGTETIDLPSDFFKIKNLYILRSDGYRLLSYRNNLTKDYSTSGETSGEMYCPVYFLRADTIVLHPVPNFTSTDERFLLEYVQFPTTMITGGDSLTTNVSPVFKDLIVMYAVYKAKMRESLVNGVDTSALALQNLNDLFTAFKEIVGKQSANPTYVIPFSPEDL